MNLFDLFVKVAVKDEASDKVSKLSGSLGSGLKAAASVGVAAITAAATGIAALTTAAVKNYAEYEQLVGGAKLLYGDAYDYIQTKSAEAYKNVQMSQNEYLQQVNGFATGLKTALGGNEQAAAELADKIITAEADIVAATGQTQDMVQNAFNGIMKSNYTMLDNLQLGITPTKEGFQEMIDIVNEWNKANGEATNYQITNLADAQSALLDYIEMQGLSGYAATEAAGTISGSVASMKAAWQNLLVGVADDTADFDGLVNNFVESVGVAAENVIPRVTTALNGAAQLISALLPVVFEALPQIVNDVAPQMAEAAVAIVQALIDGISGNQDQLMTSAFDVIMILVNGIVTLLPQIISLGLQLIVALANGLASAAPSLVPVAVDAVFMIADAIISNAPALAMAAINLISQLLIGLVNAFPSVVTWVVSLPQKLVDLIIQNAPALFDAGWGLVEQLNNGFVIAWNSFMLIVKGLINELLTLVGEAIEGIAGWFGKEIEINVPQIDTSFEEGKIAEAKAAMGGGTVNNYYINNPKETVAQTVKETKYLNNRKVLTAE